jgi:hypothetical protein
MRICTVNGSEHEVGAGLETWGQLLATLERGDGPERAVVTAVRVGGVDQPTFREPLLLALDLNTAAPIDVETSAARDLVAQARQTALDGLEALATGARLAAEAFRLHDLPRAQRGLLDFVTTFRLLTTLTAALARAEAPAGNPGLDPQGAEFLEQLGANLESLIAFNVNEDWISVADVLEYEIADVLPHWAAILQDEEDDCSARVIAAASRRAS